MFDEAAQALSEGLKRYPASIGLTGRWYRFTRMNRINAAARELAESLPTNTLQTSKLSASTSHPGGHRDNEAAAALAEKLFTLAPHDADFLI